MIDICEQPIDDDTNSDCPLCPVTIPVSALRVHLATHLEDLALFVLPINVEARSHDPGSDQAEGAPGHIDASEASDREDGLPLLDFDTEPPDPGYTQRPGEFSALLEHNKSKDNHLLNLWMSSNDENLPVLEYVASDLEGMDEPWNEKTEAHTQEDFQNREDSIDRESIGVVKILTEEPFSKTDAGNSLLGDATPSLISISQAEPPNDLGDMKTLLVALSNDIEDTIRTHDLLQTLVDIITDKPKQKKSWILGAALVALQNMIYMDILDRADLKSRIPSLGSCVRSCYLGMMDILRLVRDSVCPLTPELNNHGSIWRPTTDMNALEQSLDDLVRNLLGVASSFERSVNELDEVILTADASRSIDITDQTL